MIEKVLVIGASGFVGYALYEHFLKKYNVVGTYNTNKINNLLHLNILDKIELEKVLNAYKPEIILLPAALSNVEFCEQNGNACWNQNVTAPLNLINLIKNSAIKLVYYSTDYIFDGENGPYSEDDYPNPINNYGKAKLETENNIRENLTDFLILRTTVVYGWEHQGKNFIYRLIKETKNGKVTKVPTDQMSTPTYIENLTDATLKLVESNSKGIFNVVGSALVDRYTFAQIASDVFNLNKSLIKPVLTSELNQIASRPLNAGLKINKLQKTIHIKMVDPLEGLRKMKKNQKDYVKFD